MVQCMVHGDMGVGMDDVDDGWEGGGKGGGGASGRVFSAVRQLFQSSGTGGIFSPPPPSFVYGSII